MWNNGTELMQAIYEAHERLKNGEVPVDQAHAQARMLGTACKLLGIRLEHARLTGRLEQGSVALPDFEIGEGE